MLCGDAGFHSSIIALARNTLRPIVLTSEIPLPFLNALNSRSGIGWEEIVLARSSTKDIMDALSELSVNRPENDMEVLVWLASHDRRACLTSAKLAYATDQYPPQLNREDLQTRTPFVRFLSQLGVQTAVLDCLFEHEDDGSVPGSSSHRSAPARSSRVDNSSVKAFISPEVTQVVAQPTIDGWEFKIQGQYFLQRLSIPTSVVNGFSRDVAEVEVLLLNATLYLPPLKATIQSDGLLTATLSQERVAAAASASGRRGSRMSLGFEVVVRVAGFLQSDFGKTAHWIELRLGCNGPLENNANPRRMRRISGRSLSDCSDGDPDDSDTDDFESSPDTISFTDFKRMGRRGSKGGKGQRHDVVRDGHKDLERDLTIELSEAKHVRRRCIIRDDDDDSDDFQTEPSVLHNGVSAIRMNLPMECTQDTVQNDVDSIDCHTYISVAPAPAGSDSSAEYIALLEDAERSRDFTQRKIESVFLESWTTCSTNVGDLEAIDHMFCGWSDADIIASFVHREGEVSEAPFEISYSTEDAEGDANEVQEGQRVEAGEVVLNWWDGETLLSEAAELFHAYKQGFSVDCDVTKVVDVLPTNSTVAMKYVEEMENTDVGKEDAVDTSEGMRANKLDGEEEWKDVSTAAQGVQEKEWMEPTPLNSLRHIRRELGGNLTSSLQRKIWRRDARNVLARVSDERSLCWCAALSVPTRLDVIPYCSAILRCELAAAASRGRSASALGRGCRRSSSSARTRSSVIARLFGLSIEDLTLQTVARLGLIGYI